jgi:arylsulfatase A-like enzyme
VLARLSPRFNGNGMPHWFQDFQRPAPEVLNAAYRWIRERDARPWFCMINLYDVHWPYTPGERAKAAFVEPYEGIVDGYLFRSDSYERPPDVARGARIQPADRRHLIQLYDAEMFELDHHVGAFLDALHLESSGTAVILTSDHGEGFGEAGRFEHDDICEPQVRVPFLVYEPRAEGREPRTGEARVRTSGVDVAPTLLGLAGVPVPGHMTGIDLAHEEPEPDRLILVEDRDKLHARNHHYAVYRGPWKLLQTGVGESAKVELFDLRIDQVGMYDVGDKSPDVRASLLAELRALRAQWGGDAERFDERGAAGNRATQALGYGGGGDDDEE